MLTGAAELSIDAASSFEGQDFHDVSTQGTVTRTDGAARRTEGLGFVVQTHRPEVTGETINGIGNQNRSGVATLVLQFDQAVTVHDATSLKIFNHTTGAPLDISAATLQNNRSTAVTWEFSGVHFADGFYTAELPHTQAANAQGESLAATHSFLFHVLVGDSNGDAGVNFGDYFDLLSHYGTTNGPRFGPGDLGGDGHVNFSDVMLLQRHFGNHVRGPAVDFGDAPQTGTSYPTTLANNGARHVIGSGTYLGSKVNGESIGLPDANRAGANRTDASEDEDGVTWAPLQAGTNAGVTVTAAVPNGQTAVLNAWIDFNADGDWDDAGEQVFVDQALSNGPNQLTIALPTGIAQGVKHARFRATGTAGYSYFGLAPDGEVEDYELTVAAVTPHVQFRLETTDLAGTPVTSVQLGQQFQLHVYVADVRPVPTGVFAGYLDVSYDPQLVSLASGPHFTQVYPNVLSGDTSTPGLIDEVGGAAGSISPLGAAEQLLFHVTLTATAAGSSTLRAGAADQHPVNDLVVYGQDTAIPTERIDYGMTTIQISGGSQKDAGSWTLGPFVKTSTLTVQSAAPAQCNVEVDVTADPVTIYEDGDGPSGGGISGKPGFSDVTVESAQTGGTCSGTLPAEIRITGDPDAYAVMDPDERLAEISPPQSNPRVFAADMDPADRFTFQIVAQQDADFDGETVTVTASVDVNGDDAPDSSGSDNITIIDDDGPPTLHIEQLDREATEPTNGPYYCSTPGDGGLLHIWVEDWNGAPLTITLTQTGSAESLDYSLSERDGDPLASLGNETWQLTLLGNHSYVYVTPRADADHDDETVRLALHPPSGIALANHGDSVAITDTDPEGLLLSAPDDEARELDLDEGAFRIEPQHSDQQLCTTINLIIDATDAEADPARATNNLAVPGGDYHLEYPPGHTLGLTPLPVGPNGEQWYRSEDITVSQLNEVTVLVVPHRDSWIENTEDVVAWNEGFESDRETVHILDDSSGLPAQIEIDTRPDPNAECSCSCDACAATGVVAELQDGSVRYAPHGSLAYLPQYFAAGTHGTQPVIRSELTKPQGGWPSSIAVVVNVDDDGGSQIASEPFVLDTDNYTGSKIAFAVPLDLSGQVTGSYRIELLATGESAIDPEILTWQAETSYLLHNLRDDSDIAPGWTFPFLSQLVDTLSMAAASGESQQSSGVAVFRGDNSVSWYSDGQNRPPESLSELVTETHAGQVVRVLQHRYGNRDLYAAHGFTAQVNGVPRTWPQGSLWKSVDRNGNETVYEYTAGQLSKVIDPRLHETTFTYAATGSTSVLTVTDFAGRESRFAYDSISREMTITHPDPDGPVTGKPAPRESLSYDQLDRLTRITRHSDEAGILDQTTSLSYEPMYDLDGDGTFEWGRLARISRPDNSTWTLQNYRQREALPDPSTRHWASPLLSQDPHAARSSLDTFENVAEVKDGNGNISRYELDHLGRVLRMTDAHNQTFVFERNRTADNDRGEIAAITTPDPDNFLSRPDLLDGGDGPLAPLVTSLEYDNRSNLLRRTLPSLDGDQPLMLQWSDYVPSVGRAQVALNELGQETRYTVNVDSGDIESVLVVAPRIAPQVGLPQTPWQNPFNRLDVSRDTYVSPVDALHVINDLNQNGSRPLRPSLSPEGFVDTNGDSFVAPIDALV